MIIFLWHQALFIIKVYENNMKNNKILYKSAVRNARNKQ